MKTDFKFFVVIILSLGLFSACSEADLDPSLEQVKNLETSVKTEADLRNVLIGAYNQMSSYFYYGRNVILLGEVFSDNCTSIGSSNRFVNEAAMNVVPSSEVTEQFWRQAYKVVAQANIIIHAENIKGDQEKINQIKGQAYALRALSHFDLLRFYGQQNLFGGGLSSPGVPYVTTFRNLDKLAPSRKTVREVRDLVLADLEKAESLMTLYSSKSNEYITAFAVDALRARVALYFGDWELALSSAEEVIQSKQFVIASASDFLANFALDNTPSSIFEMAYSGIDNEGINGLTYLYQDTNYGDIIVLPNLVDIYGEYDVRGEGGIITFDGKYYRNTGKYPSLSLDDNVSLIRYAEIILIKAEALYELNKPTRALTWLNKIPSHRNAATYQYVTKANILLERRKELAFEGFRFHTLARLEMDIPIPDPLLQTHGGPAYGSYNYALPIPASEINANGNIEQNAGY